MTQTLIEQLEKLPEYWSSDIGDAIVKVDDLRAIIEQAKREAVEPIAVPAGYKLVPIEPTDDMKRAYTDKYGFPSYGAGHEYRFMVKEAPESTQQDHTKLIGELVEALEKAEKCLVNSCMSQRNKVYPKPVDRVRVANYCNRAITKAREAIK